MRVQARANKQSAAAISLSYYEDTGDLVGAADDADDEGGWMYYQECGL